MFQLVNVAAENKECIFTYSLLKDTAQSLSPRTMLSTENKNNLPIGTWECVLHGKKQAVKILNTTTENKVI
jgi:hypothetical protein